MIAYLLTRWTPRSTLLSSLVPGLHGVDDSSKLHSRLMETTTDQASPPPHLDVLEYLIRHFSKYLIFGLSRTRKHLKTLESNSVMTKFFESAFDPSDNCSQSLDQLPIGHRKTVSVFRWLSQDLCTIHFNHGGGQMKKKKSR